MNVCASLSRQEGGDRLSDEEQEAITDRGLSFGRNGIQNSDDKATRTAFQSDAQMTARVIAASMVPT